MGKSRRRARLGSIVSAVGTSFPHGIRSGRSLSFPPTCPDRLQGATVKNLRQSKNLRMHPISPLPSRCSGHRNANLSRASTLWLVQATALNMSNMIGIGRITIPALMYAIGRTQAMLGGWCVESRWRMEWCGANGCSYAWLGGTYVYLGSFRQAWIGAVYSFLFSAISCERALEIASGTIGLAQLGLLVAAASANRVGHCLRLPDHCSLYRKLPPLEIMVGLWIWTVEVASCGDGAVSFQSSIASISTRRFQFSVVSLWDWSAARLDLDTGFYDCFIGDE